MSSDRRREANRRNALKSTGPRTQSGKQASSRNALKHGMTAAPGTVLPHEDPAERQLVLAGLLDSWKPANAQEHLLVEQLAEAAWRMRRAERLENSLFQLQLREAESRLVRAAPRTPDSLDPDEGIAAAFANPGNGSAFSTFFRYAARAEASYYRALDRLRKLQNDRRRAESKQRKPQKPQPVHPPLASFGDARIAPSPHTPPTPPHPPAIPDTGLESSRSEGRGPSSRILPVTS